MEEQKKFFTGDDEKRILSAIKEAEARTSGEIRVRVEGKGGKDPMALARKSFEALGMRKTDLHNGVLFVLITEDRTFVILGDDGINKKVPSDFWNKVRDVVLAQFRKELFAEGLAEGIRLAGEQLANFFPCQKGDINELPDAISYKA
jgi:uncharacterized membrane protein